MLSQDKNHTKTMMGCVTVVYNNIELTSLMPLPLEYNFFLNKDHFSIIWSVLHFAIHPVNVSFHAVFQMLRLSRSLRQGKQKVSYITSNVLRFLRRRLLDANCLSTLGRFTPLALVIVPTFCFTLSQVVCAAKENQKKETTQCRAALAVLRSAQSIISPCTFHGLLIKYAKRMELVHTFFNFAKL